MPRLRTLIIAWLVVGFINNVIHNTNPEPTLIGLVTELAALVLFIMVVVRGIQAIIRRAKTKKA